MRVKAPALVAGRAPVALVLVFAVTCAYVSASVVGGSASAAVKPSATAGKAVRELDCNGQSPIQRSMKGWLCTDVRGNDDVTNQNTWDGRFYDNGEYIGHDEPDTTFLSRSDGTGDNVTWTITLGKDPAAPPGDATPGKDVSHWFELTPAPWFSMALCDPGSYPQLPCVPESDANAPACPDVFGCSPNSYPGGGSAFMEMQFYPPGNPPFVDSESCNDTDWCAAITVDSLECTLNYAQCNGNCEEPLQFAFIQTNGVPDANGAIPDEDTFLMKPGDKLRMHMFDAPAKGGGHAIEVSIADITQHTSGFMQASAANGFVTTSLVDCSTAPFNFEPEYLTAAPGNISPWTALQTNISTEFETGHWEPCTSLSDEFPNDDATDLGSDDGPNPFDETDTGGGSAAPGGVYNECNGPYETAGGPEGDESSDGICYYAGDPHTGYDGADGTLALGDRPLTTGCQDDYEQNGDLDFDGTPYWAEWPTGTSPGTYPSTFVESTPTSAGRQYSQFFFQTDIALSEGPCMTSLKGCTVPPAGPGHFYPYWSEVASAGTCVFEFGNVSTGKGVTDFGKDAEYGSNQQPKIGFPEFEGKTYDNTCPAKPGQSRQRY